LPPLETWKAERANVVPVGFVEQMKDTQESERPKTA
jgi:hypothetical protein